MVVHCTHSFLSDLPSCEDIQARVNDRFDSLFATDVDGDKCPFVCIICDQFLITKEDRCQVTVSKLKLMQKTLSWDNFPDPRRKKPIEDYFTWRGNKNGYKGDLSFMKGMALSPRGILYKRSAKNAQFGFSCCKRCKSNVTSQERRLPRHAILNNNYVGVPPKCLLDLTEVEIAFLTPVKHYGFCFVWTGGKQKMLKGTLTFMRVDRRQIANGINQLQEFGFNDHIIFLFSGSFTKAQKDSAIEKSSI